MNQDVLAMPAPAEQVQEVPLEPRRRRAFAWPQSTRLNLLLLAVVAVVFFHEVFLHPTRLVWGYDINTTHIQFKWAQWRNIHDWGTFPVWDPSQFCGQTITGDCIPAYLNPLTWVFWITPALNYFGFYFWIEVVLALWGTFLFARRKGCDPLGAFFAAAVFGLSGKTAAHLFAGHLELLTTVLCVPWFLWGADLLLTKRRWPYAALLGAIIAFSSTRGSVQMVYWNILFMLAYVFAVTVPLFFRRSWREGFGNAYWTGLALVAYAVLGAFWWFPIVRQTLLLSARVGTADYEFITFLSLTIRDLLRCVWPYLGVPYPDPRLSLQDMKVFWETSTFHGVTALFLGLAAPFALRRRPGMIGLGLLTLFILLLGLGKYAGLYSLFYQYVPGFNLFRIPGRYAFYGIFLMGLMGGLLLTYGHELPRKRRMIISWIVLFLLTLLLAYTLAPPSKFTPVGLWVPVMTLCAAFPCWLLWLYGKGPRDLWRGACVVILLGELLWVWDAHLYTVDPKKALPDMDAAAYLASLRPNEEFRYYDADGILDQQYAARYGLEGVMGYHPAVYRHFLDMYHRIWRKDISGIKRMYSHPMSEAACPMPLDLMNARYIVTTKPLDLPGHVEVHHSPKTSDVPERYVYRRESAMPRAWVVADAITPPAGKTTVTALCSMDPKATCIVDNYPIDGTAEYQEVPVERHAPADATFRFTTEANGVMILSETWHPDWRATDNGKPVEVRRVNHGQVGIPVTAGNHVLHVHYFPWDLYAGASVSFAGAAACVAGIAIRKRRVRQ